MSRRRAISALGSPARHIAIVRALMSGLCMMPRLPDTGTIAQKYETRSPNLVANELYFPDCAPSGIRTRTVWCLRPLPAASWAIGAHNAFYLLVVSERFSAYRTPNPPPQPPPTPVGSYRSNRPAPPPSEDQMTTESSPARRVIIAEDEALIRLDLKEMLQEEGYEVVAEASDGETAVRLAEEFRPDLCIFDVKMPVLDGITAAERVIEARIAPVLILTAFSQRELVERAAEAGVMNYLVKPFTKDKLVPAIEIAVSRHTQLKALEGEVADLASRLETRKLVDRAKGILQTAHGMTEPEAFRWIQKTSMDRRMTMKEVAEVVISGSSGVGTPAEGPAAAKAEQG